MLINYNIGDVDEMMLLLFTETLDRLCKTTTRQCNTERFSLLTVERKPAAAPSSRDSARPKRGKQAAESPKASKHERSAFAVRA